MLTAVDCHAQGDSFDLIFPFPSETLRPHATVNALISGRDRMGPERRLPTSWSLATRWRELCSPSSLPSQPDIATQSAEAVLHRCTEVV